MPGEAATTANNIIANEPLFRFGAASWLIVLLFDTVIAWALYIFLKPVNKSGSLLAALFRLVYVAIFASVLVNLFSALQLLSGVDYMTVFETGQLQAQVMLFLNAFDYGFLIGLAFFGVHLFVLGYLIIKSGTMPRILGFLLIIASLGYLIDSFAHFLLPNYADYATIFLLIVAVPAVIAEFALTFWLLYRGFRRPAAG